MLLRFTLVALTLISASSCVCFEKQDGCWRVRMSGRKSCVGKVLKKGPWSSVEDEMLSEYVRKNGEGNWNSVQKVTELQRCGKSCRLRWSNHLKPTLKKGAITPEEEDIIISLHAQLGNKWAKMASQLSGRTDNEIKNYWNTRSKRLQRKGEPLYPPKIQSQVSQINQHQTAFYAAPFNIGYGSFLTGHPQQQMVQPVFFNATPAPATPISLLDGQYLQPQPMAVAQLPANQVQPSYAMVDISTNQVVDTFAGPPMIAEQLVFTRGDQVLSNDDDLLLQMDIKTENLYDLSNPSPFLGNDKNVCEINTNHMPAQDFSNMAGLLPANGSVISNSGDLWPTHGLPNITPDDGLKETVLIPNPAMAGSADVNCEMWNLKCPWGTLPKLC